MPYLQISTSQTVEIECAQPFYKIEDETFIASHDSEWKRVLLYLNQLNLFIIQSNLYYSILDQVISHSMNFHHILSKK